MAKVDTSDLGPNANEKESVDPERNNEEHKIIEGAGDSAPSQTRENELNLGNDGGAQVNGEAGKANNQHSEHLNSDCFARVEF